jgi:hypothetical protein
MMIGTCDKCGRGNEQVSKAGQCFPCDPLTYTRDWAMERPVRYGVRDRLLAAIDAARSPRPEDGDTV